MLGIYELFELHISKGFNFVCFCHLSNRISQALCGQDQYLIVGNQVPPSLDVKKMVFWCVTFFWFRYEDLEKLEC